MKGGPLLKRPELAQSPDPGATSGCLWKGRVLDDLPPDLAPIQSSAGTAPSQAYKIVLLSSYPASMNISDPHSEVDATVDV